MKFPEFMGMMNAARIHLQNTEDVVREDIDVCVELEDGETRNVRMGTVKNGTIFLYVGVTAKDEEEAAGEPVWSDEARRVFTRSQPEMTAHSIRPIVVRERAMRYALGDNRHDVRAMDVRRAVSDAILARRNAR